MDPRIPLPQTFINFVIKNLAGVFLSLFQRQVVKVSNPTVVLLNLSTTAVCWCWCRSCIYAPIRHCIHNCYRIVLHHILSVELSLRVHCRWRRTQTRPTAKRFGRTALSTSTGCCLDYGKIAGMIISVSGYISITDLLCSFRLDATVSLCPVLFYFMLCSAQDILRAAGVALSQCQQLG